MFRSLSSAVRILRALPTSFAPRELSGFRPKSFGSGIDSRAAVAQRRLCSSQSRQSLDEPLEVFPLPEGVDGSRIGLYELIGTEGTGTDGDGYRAVLAVHQPRETWRGMEKSRKGAGGGIFAGVEVAGKQYKVTAGDTLWTHRIDGEVNSQIVLDKVCIVGTVLWSVFGRPRIPAATVTCTVEAQTLTARVIVTKFKKRKGYTRRKGHRQPITRLHIDKVEYALPSADKIVPHEVNYNPLRPPISNRPRFI
jgi:large subunit ribosomal protein L21